MPSPTILLRPQSINYYYVKCSHRPHIVSMVAPRLVVAHFAEKKMFGFKFHWNCSQKFNWQKFSIASDNGMVPVWHQGITEANDDTVTWRDYVSNSHQTPIIQSFEENETRLLFIWRKGKMPFESGL